MFSLLSLVLLSCSLNFVWTETLYQDCGSELATIESLNITDCLKPPCTMMKEHTYAIDIRFKAKAASASATIIIQGIIYGKPAPVSLSETNFCKMGANCPIVEGDVDAVSLSMPILSTFPSIPFDLKVEIKADDQKQHYVCILVSVSIVENSDFKDEL